MISISKKVEYSISLIAYLSKFEGKIISLKDASQELGLPYRFLAQLASALKQGGLLESKEGKTGGYNLEKSWKSRNIYDLVKALGENDHMVKCLAGGKCVREAKCNAKMIWQKLETVFVDELKNIKLSELQ
jgi:Rrf2 family iron-sulfur cluster assembly transcriptional regulator